MAYIGNINLVNTTGQPVPTADQTLYLLRRTLHLLETQAACDAQQRKKLTIDAITGALTLATISTISNAVPVGNIATVASMGDEMFINVARAASGLALRPMFVATGYVSGQ
jgi:hypothetical protein